MRIVYDSDVSGLFIPHAPPGETSRREPVIVISARREPEDRGFGGLSVSGADYEVRVSAEALARDRGVRAHEQAHLAALGGAAASPVMYDTVMGPGGQSLATGGRIAVDMSEVPGDPAATLRKARLIIAAAYAPGDPSAADMRTAARAWDMARKAREELARDNTVSMG